MKQRCSWTKDDPIMKHYHDTEWGVPLHDARKLFEFIVLDSFQAGLSWPIIFSQFSGIPATLISGQTIQVFAL